MTIAQPPSIHQGVVSPTPNEIAMLPHRDEDPVLTLHAHYFLVAELMLLNYKKLVGKRGHGRQARKSDSVRLPIYFFTWLGFLGVTAEGFKKLGIRSLVQDSRPRDFVELIPNADEILKLLKQHDDALRKVRNNVFHLRKNTEDIELFFYERPGRLKWAEGLQNAFKKFFSDYRILCQTYYALGNRSDELFK